MAKRSKIAADRRRREIVSRYARLRATLKETVRSPASSIQQLREMAHRGELPGVRKSSW